MIFVECKPDRVLVESITGISRRKIRHAGNKPRVCKELERRRNCKGLVDEDPWSVQPPYLRRMVVVEDLSSFGIKILYDESRSNYLVVLCPRLEEWILEAAKEAKIDLRKYGLPRDVERFHREVSVGLVKFERLISDLKGHSERIEMLKRSLEWEK
jgi:hypothetical protein